MNKQQIIRRVFGDKNAERLRFFLSRKKILSISNPTLFSEKIINRMLYPQELFTYLSDKVLVRQYVKSKIGEEYLVPSYGNFKEVNKEVIEELPESFVIKANHGSGYNHLVKNKRELGKNTLDKINDWLREDYSKKFYESHYKGIEPRLLVEKMLIQDGGIPNDFKVHVFNNSTSDTRSSAYLQIIFDQQLSNRKGKRCWLDENLNVAPFKQNGVENDIYPHIDSKKFKEIIRLAKLLTGEIRYCRVDFYLINDRIYFGEMTFTPMGGNLRFSPKKWDQKLGGKFGWPEPHYNIREYLNV